MISQRCIAEPLPVNTSTGDAVNAPNLPPNLEAPATDIQNAEKIDNKGPAGDEESGAGSGSQAKAKPPEKPLQGSQVAKKVGQSTQAQGQAAQAFQTGSYFKPNLRSNYKNAVSGTAKAYKAMADAMKDGKVSAKGASQFQQMMAQQIDTMAGVRPGLLDQQLDAGQAIDTPSLLLMNEEYDPDYASSDSGASRKSSSSPKLTDDLLMDDKVTKEEPSAPIIDHYVMTASGESVPVEIVSFGEVQTTSASSGDDAPEEARAVAGPPVENSKAQAQNPNTYLMLDGQEFTQEQLTELLLELGLEPGQEEDKIRIAGVEYKEGFLSEGDDAEAKRKALLKNRLRLIAGRINGKSAVRSLSNVPEKSLSSTKLPIGINQFGSYGGRRSLSDLVERSFFGFILLILTTVTGVFFLVGRHKRLAPQASTTKGKVTPNLGTVRKSEGATTAQKDEAIELDELLGTMAAFSQSQENESSFTQSLLTYYKAEEASISLKPVKGKHDRFTASCVYIHSLDTKGEATCTHIKGGVRGTLVLENKLEKCAQEERKPGSHYVIFAIDRKAWVLARHVAANKKPIVLAELMTLTVIPGSLLSKKLDPKKNYKLVDGKHWRATKEKTRILLSVRAPSTRLAS